MSDDNQVLDEELEEKDPLETELGDDDELDLFADEVEED